jgi:hypothetical protein
MKKRFTLYRTVKGWEVFDNVLKMRAFSCRNKKIALKVMIVLEETFKHFGSKLKN